MENDTINKYDSIRREWDTESKDWYFSIVDVIAIVTKSTDPRNYWKVLKNRLKNGQNKLVTECNQVKMKSRDGKFYLTDVANQETITEIIKLISEEKVLPFRLWADKLDKKNPQLVNQLEKYISSFNKEENTYPQVIYKNENFENKIAENDDNIDNEDMMLTIDGYIENDNIIIKTFVAGANIENILISATCKEIIIKGERKLPLARTVLANGSERNNIEKYSYEELYWGKFSRTITLPEEVEINNIEVTESHGLLTIKLPIINKSRSKIIKIKSL